MISFLCKIKITGQSPTIILRGLCSATMDKKFDTLAVSYPKEFVAHVELNRPDRLNAFNKAMWL